MVEANKKDFATMMRVTWANYGRNAPDKELMRFWYEKLNDHGLEVVGNAFDKWINTNADDLPSLKNIADMCKPNPTIFARLPSPLATAHQKEKADEFLAKALTFPSTTKDYRKWARDLISGEKVSNAPDLAIKYAKEALSINSYAA